MRLHPSHRRTPLLRGVALLASCLGLVVVGAAPASSSGQLSGATGYEVLWTFSGGVETSLTEKSYSFVDDLREATQGDRAISKPDRGESVTIARQPCTPGNYNTSAVTIYGSPDWFNTARNGVVGVRVSLMCKRQDGSQHRYRWGYATGQVNCVGVTRTEGDATNSVGAVFSIAPRETNCPVEHVIISNSGKATPVADGSLAFTSSIELLSLKQQ